MTLYETNQRKFVEYFGLAYGRLVRVERISDSNKNGWGTSWIDSMDKGVGKIFTISSISPKNGFELAETAFYFPYFVCSPLDNNGDLIDPGEDCWEIFSTCYLDMRDIADINKRRILISIFRKYLNSFDDEFLLKMIGR